MDRLFDYITREVMVLLIAAMPLMELRGAIPIGVSLGLHPLHATVLGILGSLAPVPFLLIFIKPIVIRIKNLPWINKLVNRMIQRTRRKGDKIRKYSVIGLVLFVAVPLPSTGVWSGCLAAVLFNIPFKHALPSIALGTSIAGTIMFILSYVAVHL
ncbi:small multi-drug export protein [Serpentinicella sp. ANB-PHB4]|uniref:COG2426 family protein n=1 Tax=Serpentinicella sp. ANB-PHB4 TaxID=3074076 RepID=UPI0028554825|nr:small multi-drug export protein [Serpentinicella sp. ANB-PHB4]MDR5659764.1 small multi-drug export protein [Serpentinicella sp. ANB-PHB4]